METISVAVLVIWLFVGFWFGFYFGWLTCLDQYTKLGLKRRHR
jgi:hypothetical protein